MNEVSQFPIVETEDSTPLLEYNELWSVFSQVAGIFSFYIMLIGFLILSVFIPNYLTSIPMSRPLYALDTTDGLQFHVSIQNLKSMHSKVSLYLEFNSHKNNSHMTGPVSIRFLKQNQLIKTLNSSFTPPFHLSRYCIFDSFINGYDSIDFSAAIVGKNDMADILHIEWEHQKEFYSGFKLAFSLCSTAIFLYPIILHHKLQQNIILAIIVILHNICIFNLVIPINYMFCQIIRIITIGAIIIYIFITFSNMTLSVLAGFIMASVIYLDLLKIQKRDSVYFWPISDDCLNWNRFRYCGIGVFIFGIVLISINFLRTRKIGVIIRVASLLVVGILYIYGETQVFIYRSIKESPFLYILTVGSLNIFSVVNEFLTTLIL